jgi:hypothetical protein
MCGRAKLPDDVSEIKFDLKIDLDEIGNHRPRWNAVPLQFGMHRDIERYAGLGLAHMEQAVADVLRPHEDSVLSSLPRVESQRQCEPFLGVDGVLCLICGNVILGPGVIAVRLRSLILIPCVGSAVHNSAVIANCIRCRIALSQFRAWCGVMWSSVRLMNLLRCWKRSACRHAALGIVQGWPGGLSASPVTVPRSSESNAAVIEFARRIPRSLAKLGHDWTANPIPRQLAVGVEA